MSRTIHELDARASAATLWAWVGVALGVAGVVVTIALAQTWDRLADDRARSEQAARVAAERERDRLAHAADCRDRGGAPFQMRPVRADGALGAAILTCAGGSLRLNHRDQQAAK